MNHCLCCICTAPNETEHKEKMFLHCRICNKDFHTDCIGITKNHFRNMTNAMTASWMCVNCQHMFPFNNIIDDEMFEQCCNDLSMTNFRFNDDVYFTLRKYEENERFASAFRGEPEANHFNDILSDINKLSSSKYYSTSDLESEGINELGLTSSILHVNIRSINKYCQNFSHLVDMCSIPFDIIAMSETWLSPNNNTINYLDDYNHIFNQRNGKSGGGVSLFVKKNMQYTERNDMCMMNSSIESVFIECPSQGHKSIIYGCVYRPPNTPIYDFIDHFTTIVDKIILKEKKLCYIAGDFNIDVLKCETHLPTQSFIDLLLSYSLIPLINRPTRIGHSKASIINNILTNDLMKKHYVNGIFKYDVSDHFPIFHISPEV